MKKMFIKLAVLCFVVIILIMLFFWHSLSFAFRVDKGIREEVGNLLIEQPPLSNDIYELDFRSGLSKTPLKIWGDKLVRIIIKDTDNSGHNFKDGARTYIETSDENGKKWMPLTYLEKSSCSYSFTYLEKLYCIVDLSSIAVITEDGRVEYHDLFPQTREKTTTLIAMIKKSNNSTVFVWSDDRSRSINPISYSLALLLAVPLHYEWGPSVIIAGKLNLDTMQTVEHIIQYGPDSGGFIYDNKIWRSLTIKDDGISEYPKPLK